VFRACMAPLLLAQARGRSARGLWHQPCAGRWRRSRLDLPKGPGGCPAGAVHTSLRFLKYTPAPLRHQGAAACVHLRRRARRRGAAPRRRCWPRRCCLAWRTCTTCASTWCTRAARCGPRSAWRAPGSYPDPPHPMSLHTCTTCSVCCGPRSAWRTPAQHPMRCRARPAWRAHPMRPRRTALVGRCAVGHMHFNAAGPFQRAEHDVCCPAAICQGRTCQWLLLRGLWPDCAHRQRLKEA
jgi:hypothetical protein